MSQLFKKPFSSPNKGPCGKKHTRQFVFLFSSRKKAPAGKCRHGNKCFAIKKGRRISMYQKFSHLRTKYFIVKTLIFYTHFFVHIFLVHIFLAGAQWSLA